MEGGIAVMARRYNEIKGLAEFTAGMIVSSEEDWKKFLHTAGHILVYDSVCHENPRRIWD